MEPSRISSNFTKSRFADYFVICGLDISSGLEPDTFAGDKLGRPPLERPYRCRVLGHYPETVPWNPFDKDAVSMLCLPHGLQFRTQKHSVDPKFHSFVITKQDGSRTYGASYVFFEEARNRKICSAMQTLQAMHFAELSSGRYKTQRTGSGNEGSTRSLPRHFKLSAASTKHRAAQSYYDDTKDILYVTKSIAIISQYPFVHASQAFLSGLFRCWKEQGKPSLESHVYSLLYEVTVPQPGRSISFVCYPNERVVLHRPTIHNDELPLFDFPLRELFTLLGVEAVLQLFTCLLLENQILLCSTDYQRLMLVAESLTVLLLPFSWPHVYVPILPSSCNHFLDAPVPFLMGLHTLDETRTAGEANLCFVDLDNKLIQLPEDLPFFPNRNEFTYELSQALEKFKVCSGQLDLRNMNTGGDLMTSSCILTATRTRKHSWANELDDPDPISDHLDSFTAINAKHTGSYDNDNGLWESLEDDGFSEETDGEALYMKDQRINNGIRQIFINRFVHIFYDYERFIIQPNQDKEQWLSNRESMQNFDKASFLSDQPQNQLPFLSRFIDTQMFATLVDNKIFSTWSKMDLNLRVFESRISSHRKKFESGRASYYEKCTTVEDSQALLDYRISNIDIELSQPREIMSRPSVLRQSQGFPILDNLLLNQEAPRRRGGRLTESHSSVSLDEMESKSRGPSEAAPLRQTRLATLPKDKQPDRPTSAIIAHTNWNFVEQLLKDCKTRTKKMLVEKLGSEAIDMGHSEATSLVEENTLIASLCDLLERVWSHGLHVKQGKSALWSHLVSYLELEDKVDSNRLTHPNSPAEPARLRFQEKILYSIKTSNLMDFIVNNFDLSGSSDGEEPRSPRTRSEVARALEEQPVIRPLPTTLAYDLRSVQAMTEIKTNFGYARAFVRLSLEKKLLSRHLRTLLSDSQLLKSRYKRYAFLLCEEEKDQFLYHLLTLNAVDYYCFTNAYLNTRVPYRVAVFPSKRTSSTTSANCWIIVSGTNCETSRVPIPRGELQFVFHHKNLGILTTVRLGHDNSGLSPKWLVDYIVVRNEISGHAYSFECGRWLGRGIDDDSTERLLIGSREEETSASRTRSQARLRSPSAPPPKKPLPLQEIHHMLGNSINNLVKQFYSRSNRCGPADPTVTSLLCGESGLVTCLQHAFLHGFKSSRLFGRNLYLWDYFVKVREEREYANDADEVDRYFCNLIETIINSNQSLGKDGKFQVFICIGIRDHMLHHMIEGPLSRCRNVLDMYEENSFFRDPNLISYIFQLLESLDDYDIAIENSLTQGIKS